MFATIKRWFVRLRRSLARTPLRWRQWLGRVATWRRLLRPLARWAWYGSAAALIAIALVFTGVRLYLPVLAERKVEFEDYLSRQAGYRVRMAALTAYWDGPNPGFRVSGFEVYSPDTRRPAVNLDELRVTLAWLPLLRGRLSIASLVLVQPRLTIERLDDGRYQVTGLRPFEDAATPDTAGASLAWLFAQSSLTIEGGELRWVDHLSNDDPLHLNDVNFTLRNNGSRHRVGLRARFPADMCSDCLVVADVRGNPLTDEFWRGEIYVRAIGLDAATLPAILRTRLPAGFTGRADVDLLGKWERARLRRLEGKVSIAGLALPQSDVAPVTIKHLGGEIKWRGSKDGQWWRLDLTDLSLGLTREPWRAERLRIERRGTQLGLQVRNVELDDLVAFAANLPVDSEFRSAVLNSKPRGRIRNLQLRAVGDLAAPTDYTVSGDLTDLHIAAQDRFPGVEGLSGRIDAGASSGELTMTSRKLSIDLPGEFAQPLELGTVYGRLHWERSDGAWVLGAQQIEVTAPDGNATAGFDLRLPQDPARSPQLKLRIDYRNLDVAAIPHYYPIRMHPKLRAWLQGAVLRGRISSGHLIYSGPVRQFPFRAGEGKFEAQARVTGGVFEYLPGWPVIEDIDADVHFQGAALGVTVRSGRLNRLSVSRVAANIADLSPSADGTVAVSGQITGATGDLLGALYASEPPWLAFLPRGIDANGQAALSLDIRVPVHAPADTRVTGVVHLSDSALRLPDSDIAVESIDGELRFDERGPLTAQVGGRLFGGPMSLTLSRVEREWLVRTRGTLSAAGLRPLIGASGVELISGEAPWDAVFRIRHSGSRASFFANLQSAAIALPAPLSKPLDQPAGLRIDAVDQASGTRRVDVRFGDHLNVRLDLVRDPAAGWTLARGRAAVGDEPRLGDEPGLHLSIRNDRLDADAWWRTLQSAMPDDAGAGWRKWLSRVSMDVKAMRLYDRELGALGIDMTRWPESWRGQLRGDVGDGAVLLTTASPGLGVELDLDRLTIPPPAESDVGRERADPRRVPRLRVSARRLQALGRDWGGLELRGSPTRDGWLIETFALQQSSDRIDATGRWSALSPGIQRTELNASLRSQNFGDLLARYGYPDEMVGGTAAIELVGGWNGAPMEFSLSQLDGELTGSIDSGRLVQVKQGTGRILGVLDINSLTRYLSLDFSNLFGKGFTFDSIRGQATVERGNAYTRDLAVKGPSAHISLSGRVGLATQDLDLEVDVIPRFKEELAVTGLILGSPVVGAAVLAAQELLKKPLEQGARISYTVKGGWREPVVAKVPKLTVLNPAQD